MGAGWMFGLGADGDVVAAAGVGLGRRKQDGCGQGQCPCRKKLCSTPIDRPLHPGFPGMASVPCVKSGAYVIDTSPNGGLKKNDKPARTEFQ
jgi:hypothetical protein